MKKIILILALAGVVGGCSHFQNAIKPNLLYEKGMKFRVDQDIAACLRIYSHNQMKRGELRCYVVPPDALELWMSRTLQIHTVHDYNRF